MFSGLEQVGNRQVSPDDFVREIDYVNKALTGTNKSMVIHHLKDFLTGQDDIPNKRTLFHKTLSKIDPEKADKLLESVARLVHTVAVVLTDETLDLSPEEKAKITSNLNFMPEETDPRSEEEKRSLVNSRLSLLPRDVLGQILMPYTVEGKTDLKSINESELLQAYPDDLNANHIFEGKLNFKDSRTVDDFVKLVAIEGKNVRELVLDPHYKNLEGEIDIRINALAEVTDRIIESCPNLLKITFDTSKVTAQELIPQNTPLLTDLIIYIPKFPKKGDRLKDLANFDNLPNLKNITLFKSDDPGSNFYRKLLNVSSLKTLSIIEFNSVSLESFSSNIPLTNSNLEQLTLTGTLIDLTKLSGLKKLTHLNLEIRTNFEELDKLSTSDQLTSLTHVTLVDIGDKSYKPLTEDQKRQLINNYAKRNIYLEFSKDSFLIMYKPHY